jgi:hypothetical protein
MRALSINDVVGLNSITLPAAPIVAQPFESFREKPSVEIFPPQSEHKAAPQAGNSPPAPSASPPAMAKHADLPLENF